MRLLKREINAIVEMARQGYSYSKIASMSALNRSQVKRICESRGFYSRLACPATGEMTVAQWLKIRFVGIAKKVSRESRGEISWK